MPEIRRLHPSEWEALRDVRLRALQQDPYAFGSTYAREKDLTDTQWQSRAADLPWFVAWDQYHPIGLVAARPLEDGWEVLSMWTDPAWRGRNVAVQLVDAMRQEASRQNAPRLSLYVTDGNDRARAFYAKLGFVPTGQRKQLASNPSVGEDQLQLLL